MALSKILPGQILKILQMKGSDTFEDSTELQGSIKNDVTIKMTFFDSFFPLSQFVTIFSYPFPHGTAQKLTKLSSERQTIKYMLVLI